MRARFSADNPHNGLPATQDIFDTPDPLLIICINKIWRRDRIRRAGRAHNRRITLRAPAPHSLRPALHAPACPREEHSTAGRHVAGGIVAMEYVWRVLFMWTSARRRNILACRIYAQGDLMRSLSGKLALFLLPALAIAAFAASAQITTQIVFRMSRPFVVGNTTFPEGNFVIREVPGAAKPTLEFSNPRGGASVKVEAVSIPADHTIHAAEIAFNRYSNLMALSQVFPGPGKHGYQLVPGQPEKDAAKSEKPLRQTIPAKGN